VEGKRRIRKTIIYSRSLCAEHAHAHTHKKAYQRNSIHQSLALKNPETEIVLQNFNGKKEDGEMEMYPARGNGLLVAMTSVDFPRTSSQRERESERKINCRGLRLLLLMQTHGSGMSGERE
jgi:hypothetical protein